jgi:fatty-acyl-CoA synthase
MDAVDAVALQARLAPSRLAAVELDADRHYSYAELDREIGRCVAVLRARGCTRAERVVAIAKNHVLLIVLHHACARLGAIFAPFNFRLAPAELAALIAQARPRLVIGDARLPELPPGALSLDALAAEMSTAEPAETGHIDPDAPSLMLFTSGTSGKPKGALISERNLTETVLNFSLLGRVTRDCVFLCDAPMFHVIGLVNSVRAALYLGGTCLVSSGFDAARSHARLMEPALRVSHYICVPQMLDAIAAQPSFDARALGERVAVLTGGAHMPPAALRAYLEAGLVISHGYGMTEVGCMFHCPVEIPDLHRYAGSVGMPTPRVEVRIVDDAGHDCPTGTPGEILVRGDNVFLGYFEDLETTRAAFRDGFFATGDLGRRDASGHYYIVDRKKDMFISGGENVYPAEIEAHLRGFPGVREAAVVGVPDARWGEVGHLAIVAEAGAQLDFAVVLSHLEGVLARFKLPKHFTLLAQLPRTASGKVQRQKLRSALLGKA